MGKLYLLKILQRYFYENYSFSAVGKTHVTTFLFTFAGNVHLFLSVVSGTRFLSILYFFQNFFKVVDNKNFLKCKFRRLYS